MPRFIVTGGAGFIGSNIVRVLNARGDSDILVVDDLTDGRKFRNIADADIADFIDRDDFRDAVRAGDSFGPVGAVFHQGACSDTTEWDGRYMLDTNFTASKELFAWCQRASTPLIYASSAAVYGASTRFAEANEDLSPLNVYGWSKLLFDRWVARQGKTPAPVTGFRYFNVYGPGEGHKARMASVIHHFDRQLRETGVVRLFGGSHGYGDGEQRRDFVFVGDVVAANLWAAESGKAGGVYNVGTGRSQSFNDVARAVIDWHGRGAIEYVPIPEDLANAYQPLTEADITRLRADGFSARFTTIEEGVRRTLDAGAQTAT